MHIYHIVSNKRPGGVAIFQKGMFIRGKFSMENAVFKLIYNDTP